MYKIIATSLGTGYSPIAPGTAGSILGIVVWYAMNYLMGELGLNNNLLFAFDLVAIILVLFLGVKATKEVHKIWEHDASKIVIDEVVGVWITALAIPLNWKYYLYALVLFRFFDIAKPLFIRKLDKMKNDWSVMLDDVLAGIYGLISLQLILYFEGI